jgi:hypothetical protein
VNYLTGKNGGEKNVLRIKENFLKAFTGSEGHG